jgi:homoserine O-acetyltransferase/O-succinyltransferase
MLGRFKKANAMRLVLGLLALMTISAPASGADYPAPTEKDVILKDFRFHTGEKMPEVRMHALTIGDPAKPTVLVLHGTTGSAASMLTPTFAGELFGPGQPLDAAKYFIVLPDGLGVAGSSKPSDGMRTKFPAYDYSDCVLAQYRVLTEGLHIEHVRLVIGVSMGGMHTWLWGATYPGFADKIVPMASQPTAMAARNWALRRLLIETIRRDPSYRDGDYTTQPPSLGVANAFYSLATSGGNLGLEAQAPTSAKANALVAQRIATPVIDANDYVYQWAAAEDYDPSEALEKITASVLAINSADDERNPPETGLTEAAIKRIPHARLYLIPASPETRGHGTVGDARFYSAELAKFMAE